jgi:phage baseplate assembly protein W
MVYGVPNTPFWQPKLGALGETVAGLDELEQAIVLIVKTHPGSIPLKPEFGCNWLDWLDKPAAKAIPGIIRAITRAVLRWEDRVELGEIVCKLPSLTAPHLKIAWRPAGEGRAAFLYTEVTF